MQEAWPDASTQDTYHPYLSIAVLGLPRQCLGQLDARNPAYACKGLYIAPKASLWL
jgi:hypothetical protein